MSFLRPPIQFRDISQHLRFDGFRSGIPARTTADIELGYIHKMLENPKFLKSAQALFGDNAAEEILTYKQRQLCVNVTRPDEAQELLGSEHITDTQARYTLERKARGVGTNATVHKLRPLVEESVTIRRVE